MEKLRKVLSEYDKNKRYRRHLINIHITFLGWVIEFSAFLLMVLGSFVLGHGSAYVTLALQTFTMTIYLVIIPCVYLISDSDLKGIISESKYYLLLIKIFHCHRNGPN